MIDQSDLQPYEQHPDIALTRELLKLTPAQRVERMVRIDNKMHEIEDRVMAERKVSPVTHP